MAVIADLNGIKTELKSIFDSANTTTASPIDLSNSLTTRVQRVMSVNPEMIKPQASFFPFVTSYIINKNVNSDDIAGNQLNSKRSSEITIEVCGAIWNSNLITVDKDPADGDINTLMENIELTLRGNPTLNGKVTWQKPDSIDYYVTRLDHQTHLRVGILRLTAKIYY